jgi:hypothetical protein
MNWISVKDRLPEKKTYFWGFMLGKHYSVHGERRRAHEILLLYRCKNGRIYNLNVSQEYYPGKREYHTSGVLYEYSHESEYMIAWLPFEDIPLPTIPIENIPKPE